MPSARRHSPTPLARLQNPPWTRRTEKREWQKLIENKWTTIEPADLLNVTKTEGQMWLALFHFVSNDEVRLCCLAAGTKAPCLTSVDHLPWPRYRSASDTTSTRFARAN